MLLAMELRFASGVALVAFDEDMTIFEWNQAAEDLTGITKDEAVGQPCWAVLAGRDDSGGVVCHPQCSRGRLVREGRPLQTQTMNIRCTDGWRRVAVDTISVVAKDRPVFFHLMHDAPAPTVADEERQPDLEAPPHLTPRQLDVLRLLGEGASARAIAAKLGLTETTVRNHIRAVLIEFRAHSQLEAVFRARRHGLLD
jgi:PAS domain S-box-containing protein